MPTHRITDSVYSVGALDPALRVFDISMPTPYGTSYNSYLIAGQKLAIVDTVRADFWEDFKYNVECLCDLAAIDYIIINHTEPDHSGSLAKLLDIAPNAQIVCTAAAQKNLRQIMNRDFACITVKDGDTLDLGNLTLEFIVAPMLHWPDTMMTYLQEEKALFSCDMFGAHFCQCEMHDDMTLYYDEYVLQFCEYYEIIMSPFAPFVRSGLEKLEKRVIGTIMPSHGPAITEHTEERLADYAEFARDSRDDEAKTAAVFYCSAHGCTRTLAEAIADGLRRKNVDVFLLDIEGADITALSMVVEQCDAFIMGAPTINSDAPAPVWNLLGALSVPKCRGKIGAVFGSYGWSGEASGYIRSRLEQLKFKVTQESLAICFMPSDEDIEAAHEFAAQIAESI